MPNGDDKNLVRVIITVAGFRARYGSWPTTIRMPAISSLADLRDHVLTPDSFSRISKKVALVPDDAEFVAMNENGSMSHYGEILDTPGDLMADAEAWLAPETRPEARS